MRLKSQIIGLIVVLFFAASSSVFSTPEKAQPGDVNSDVEEIINRLILSPSPPVLAKVATGYGYTVVVKISDRQFILQYDALVVSKDGVLTITVTPESCPSSRETFVDFDLTGESEEGDKDGYVRALCTLRRYLN